MSEIQGLMCLLARVWQDSMELGRSDTKQASLLVRNHAGPHAMYIIVVLIGHGREGDRHKL
jgi:hypothetical protein